MRIGRKFSRILKLPLFPISGLNRIRLRLIHRLIMV
nr:MAG TPA: hypothetical protein [Caudoviricetes sp.]